MATLRMTELTLTNGKIYNNIYCELPYELFQKVLTSDEETFIEFFYIDTAHEEIPLSIRNSCIASYELAFLFDSEDEVNNFNPEELLADTVITHPEVKTNTPDCKCKKKKDTDGDKKQDDIFFFDVDDYVNIITKAIEESPTLRNIYSNVLH